MTVQATNVPTRIQPVGVYNPVNRLNQPTPPLYTPPSNGQPGGVYIPVPSIPSVPAPVKSFFGDVWDGTVDQLKDNGGAVLHPIRTAKGFVGLIDKSPRQMFHAVVDPYTTDIKSGHAGHALGRLIGNAATVGAVLLGGKFLAGQVGGGGAGVGVGGPIGDFLNGVGKVVGKVTRPIASVVGGVFHAIGSFVRWIIPGGGPSVGWR
jgi:hypothetical protein